MCDLLPPVFLLWLPLEHDQAGQFPAHTAAKRYLALATSRIQTIICLLRHLVPFAKLRRSIGFIVSPKRVLVKSRMSIKTNRVATIYCGNG